MLRTPMEERSNLLSTQVESRLKSLELVLSDRCMVLYGSTRRRTGVNQNAVDSRTQPLLVPARATTAAAAAVAVRHRLVAHAEQRASHGLIAGLEPATPLAIGHDDHDERLLSASRLVDLGLLLPAPAGAEPGRGNAAASGATAAVVPTAAGAGWPSRSSSNSCPPRKRRRPPSNHAPGAERGVRGSRDPDQAQLHDHDGHIEPS